MKKRTLILSLMFVCSLTLTACGGSSSGGAKTQNGQGAVVVNPNLQNASSPVNVAGPGVVVTPGEPLSTPYSTAVSFVPEATLGAEFYKDASGLVSLNQGGLQTSQNFGFGQDCLVPAGDYSLSTTQGGQQATKIHHYQGMIIEGVGPVTFTARVVNVSAKDFQGVWKMQGGFEITHVGNRACTGYGIPMQINFTFE